VGIVGHIAVAPDDRGGRRAAQLPRRRDAQCEQCGVAGSRLATVGDRAVVLTLILVTQLHDRQRGGAGATDPAIIDQVHPVPTPLVAQRADPAGGHVEHSILAGHQILCRRLSIERHTHLDTDCGAGDLAADVADHARVVARVPVAGVEPPQDLPRVGG